MSKKCSANGCDEKHKGHGFCDKHLRRFKRHGDPLGGGYFRAKVRPENCEVEGCERAVIGRGLCSMHYCRLTKHGDVNGGKFHWSEDRRLWRKTPNGYMHRYDPQSPYAISNGCVYQHREVMAQTIGRPLTTGETVHHVNGDRSDNSPENLELWASAQPAGQRVKDLVDWASEILAKYAPILDRI